MMHRDNQQVSVSAKNSLIRYCLRMYYIGILITVFFFFPGFWNLHDGRVRRQLVPPVPGAQERGGGDLVSAPLALAPRRLLLL